MSFETSGPRPEGNRHEDLPQDVQNLIPQEGESISQQDARANLNMYDAARAGAYVDPSRGYINRINGDQEEATLKKYGIGQASRQDLVGDTSRYIPKGQQEALERRFGIQKGRLDIYRSKDRLNDGDQLDLAQRNEAVRGRLSQVSQRMQNIGSRMQEPQYMPVRGRIERKLQGAADGLMARADVLNTLPGYATLNPGSQNEAQVPADFMAMGKQNTPDAAIAQTENVSTQGAEPVEVNSPTRRNRFTNVSYHAPENSERAIRGAERSAQPATSPEELRGEAHHVLQAELAGRNPQNLTSQERDRVMGKVMMNSGAEVVFNDQSKEFAVKVSTDGIEQIINRVSGFMLWVQSYFKKPEDGAVEGQDAPETERSAPDGQKKERGVETLVASGMTFDAVPVASDPVGKEYKVTKIGAAAVDKGPVFAFREGQWMWRGETQSTFYKCPDDLYPVDAAHPNAEKFNDLAKKLGALTAAPAQAPANNNAAPVAASGSTENRESTPQGPINLLDNRAHEITLNNVKYNVGVGRSGTFNVDGNKWKLEGLGTARMATFSLSDVTLNADGSAHMVIVATAPFVGEKVVDKTLLPPQTAQLIAQLSKGEHPNPFESDGYKVQLKKLA